MKILIICKAFFPDNSPRSFRATELAKEFTRQGHKVTVLTHIRSFDYSGFLDKYPIEIKYFGRLAFKKLTSKHFGKLFHKINRLLYMLFDYPNIEIMWKLKRALKNENKYDLMISIAVPYPVHWGTAWARTKKHPLASKWIADCGDPFMGNKLESFRYPFYFSFLEKWFCRKADFISIPVAGAKVGYYRRFHHKIRVIPQGFDFGIAEHNSRYMKNNRPSFAYAGGIAQKGVRSPMELINFLITLNRDFEFHIFSTTGFEFLVPYVEKSGGKIILENPLERDKLLIRLSELDFLVNLDNGTSVQVPSKLIDYALSGRPVINITPGFDFTLFEKFLDGDYSGQFRIGNIGQYDIKNVAGKFLNIV
jgi:hypothetical protein